MLSYNTKSILENNFFVGHSLTSKPPHFTVLTIVNNPVFHLIVIPRERNSVIDLTLKMGRKLIVVPVKVLI